MRVAAVVEQAWDPASIEVDPVRSEVDWSRAAPATSPGSLEAVELGLGLGEVRVFGLGPPPVEALLRECLAMGAAGASLAPDLHALASALGSRRFDLVLVPHRSGDHGAGCVAPLLAGLLDRPQATGVESLVAGDREVVVVRRLDRGEREQLAVPLPAVVGVEPGVARPRPVSPAALLAARSASLEVLPPAPGAPRPVLIGHSPPRPAPPRMRAPDGALPAEARIASVVGAAGEPRHRELVAGPADQVAARILGLLEERGWVEAPR